MEFVPLANTIDCWNETLRADSYKSKLDMKELREHYNLDLKPLNQFGLTNWKHDIAYFSTLLRLFGTDLGQP